KLLSGQVIIEIGRFGKEAEMLTHLHVTSRATEDVRGAAARFDQAQQDFQRRRLARTVGTEKAVDLPLLNGERQPVERVDGCLPGPSRLELLRQILDPNDLHSSTLLTSSQADMLTRHLFDTQPQALILKRFTRLVPLASCLVMPIHTHSLMHARA